MDPIRKIPKKFTKKFGNKVINRQYFCRKTGLQSSRYPQRIFNHFHKVVTAANSMNPLDAQKCNINGPCKGQYM